jgi:uncharacterized phage protein gp47/JayE
MSGTTVSFPATPVCQVTANGIVVPTFAACIAWATACFQLIYGSDVYLGNDSPDGQMMQLLATAIDDTNTAYLAVYNSFRPGYAQGAGLSSIVKINNLTRDVPSNSTVDLVCIGQPGGQQSGTSASDGTYRWNLPDFDFPSGGSITLTAICATEGSITAQPDTITIISTPNQYWQSVNNPATASPGQPVETDGTLRIRQASSAANGAVGIMAALYGALLAIDGVTAVSPYENDTDLTDANGVPANSIAMIVDGGDAQTIAQTIYLKKSLGVKTFGTTSITVSDPITGIPKVINFFVPTDVTITVAVNISIVGYTGYSSAIGAEIAAAVAAFINGQPQGGENGFLKFTRLYVPAQLLGPFAAPSSPADGSTYELLSVAISKTGGGGLAEADIPIAFNQQAVCNAANNVTINVTS